MIKNFISIFIVSFAFIIAGCSVGIRPAYYDLPPIESSQNYYGEPAYYYPNSPQTEYKYDYNSTYDPWTMGTYYNYTPPKRVSRETEEPSADNSTSTTERRPSIRDRDSSTNSASMSPRRENFAIENRANQTQSNSNPQAESSNYKHKREPSSSLDNSKSSSEEKKEEEENKDNKQKRGRD